MDQDELEEKYNSLSRSDRYEGNAINGMENEMMRGIDEDDWYM